MFPVIFYYVIIEWNLWFGRKLKVPELNIMAVVIILKYILRNGILSHYGVYSFLETRRWKVHGPAVETHRGLASAPLESSFLVGPFSLRNSPTASFFPYVNER